MSDSLFVQCPCEHCHEIIDAARDEVGITIKCPVCSQPTVIHDPTGLPPKLPHPYGELDNVKAEVPAPPDREPRIQLPELSDESLRSIQVKSSDGQRYYAVNLLDYTCTCPSFLKVQSTAPRRDVGRLCKHICTSLDRRPIRVLLHPLCLAMVKEGYGIHPGHFDRDSNGNVIYVTGVNSQGWLNVFALKRKGGRTYFRFGYNVDEGRWAYGMKPKVGEEALSRNSAVRPSRSPGSEAALLQEFTHQRLIKGLRQEQSSSGRAEGGLAWRASRSVLTGLGRIAVVTAEALIYVFFALLCASLRSGGKPRRKRRF